MPEAPRDGEVEPAAGPGDTRVWNQQSEAAMSEGEAHRGYHDMGGDAAGAIDQEGHAYLLWEKRIDAMMVLLSGPEKQLIRVDELRRAIESLGPDAYDDLSYYERWTAAITALMLEKGVVSQAELDGKVAAMKAARGDAA